MTSDLSTLSDFSKPKIISVLKDRLESGQIYTYAGPTLLSLNPNKNLPLFCANTKYAYKYDGCTDPHIYAIAERALLHKNTAIVITGESGSGKTFNFEEILKYYKCDADEVKILEYFGNAGTILNKNSSRFGKRVDLYYEGKVQGIQVTTYMLEKNRVTHGTRNGERNFHVFYHLLHDKGLIIQNDYLNNVESGNDLNESDQFEYIRGVLAKLSLCSSAVENILLGIIYLGSVTGPECINIKLVSRLLSFSPESLSNYLKYRIIKTPHDEIKTMNNQSQIIERRDTLARQLYESLFEEIVDAVNQKLRGKNDYAVGRVISLLDIYGFEVFPENKFDQFCINWANERLHSVFLEQTFENIYTLFENEGVEYTRVPVQYSSALDAIEKQCGLADLFNEKNLTLDKIEQYLTHEAVAIRNNKLWIKHYASWVGYSVEDFEAINGEAKIDYASLYNSSGEDGLVGTLLHKLTRKNQLNRPTVLKSYRKSLDSLISFLSKNAIFIRCIKPGNMAQFDDNSVHDQLIYSGLFDALAAGNQTHAYFLGNSEFERLYGLVDRSGIVYGKNKIFFSNETYKRLEKERSKLMKEGRELLKNFVLLEYLKTMPYEKDPVKETEKNTRDDDVKNTDSDINLCTEKITSLNLCAENKTNKLCIGINDGLEHIPDEMSTIKINGILCKESYVPENVDSADVCDSIGSDERFDMIDFDYVFPSALIGVNVPLYGKGVDDVMEHPHSCKNCDAVEIKYKYQCEEIRKVKKYKEKIDLQQSLIESLRKEIEILKAQGSNTKDTVDLKTATVNFNNLVISNESQEKDNEIVQTDTISENRINSQSDAVKSLKNIDKETYKNIGNESHKNIDKESLKNDIFYFRDENKISFSSPYDVFGCLIEVFLDFYPPPSDKLPEIEIKGFSHIILHAVLRIGLNPASAINMFTNQVRERYKLFEKSIQQVLYVLTNMIELRLLINGNEDKFMADLHDVCQDVDDVVNVLHSHTAELIKHSLMKDLMAVVEHQGIKEFPCSNGYFSRFFSKPVMHKFIGAFEQAMFLLDFYAIPERMKADFLTHILRFINARCFNYILTKHNFLSFNRGIQLNNNLNEIERILRTWGFIDLVFILSHLRDIVKLINLVAISTPIEGIIDTCSSLTDTHIAELISRFTNKEKESIRKDVQSFKIKPGFKFIEVGQLKCEYGGVSDLIWIVPRYVPAKYVHSIIGSLPV